MRYFVLLCLLFLSIQVAAQAVYKTVDENGNVTYTDQRPEDNSEPMVMPKISVVKTNPVPRPKQAASRSSDGKSENPYASLKILEPAPDQSFWGTGGTLVVRLNAGQALETGHQVNYYMDGTKMGTTASLMQLFANVVRGQHEVRAEIIDEAGAVLIGSDGVTFHMKQQSRLNPNNPANKVTPPTDGQRGN